MRTRPNDIFSDEDQDFVRGFAEEVYTDSDPQDEDTLPGEEEFFTFSNPGYTERQYMESPIEYDYIDESLQDIDFSQFSGDMKSSLRKIGTELKKRKHAPKKVARKKDPRTKMLPAKSRNIIAGDNHELIDRVLVPRDRAVRVEGVSDFILSNQPEEAAIKNIGYHKGEKLKELILIMNNDSELDFTVELFNPSQMLDWVVSNSQNLNNKIQVAGGNAAQYSDVLFYLLANPTMIFNGRFIVAGPSADAQRSQGLGFKNKNLIGEQFIDPLNMSSNLDTMQFQSHVLYFDILKDLGRPAIPDGMETVTYKVLAGNTVTFCFYFKQDLIRNKFLPESREVKSLKMF